MAVVACGTMGALCKVEVETVLQVAPEAAWRGFQDSYQWLPQRMPSLVKRYEYIHRGSSSRRGPGTLRLITYGTDFPEGSFSLELILDESDELMFSRYADVGGLRASQYKHYVATVSFKPGPRQSTTAVHWSLEYERFPEADPGLPRHQVSATSILSAFKALEEHVQEFSNT